MNSSFHSLPPHCADSYFVFLWVQTSLFGQPGFSGIYLLKLYQHYVDGTAICTPIQISLKMVLLLGGIGRYLVNNTYCANFVVTILVLAVIEGRAERIYADSDVDSAVSIRIVAAAVWCSP